jgi:GNAT superfamily N-acetyltransferase
VIRDAAPGDAEGIVELRARAWMRAYADFVDVAAALGEPADQIARWRGRLASDVVRTLVWDQSGAIAGFVSAGASDELGAPLDAGALRSLYVDPPAQGAGVGTALLGAAEQHLREVGFRAGRLWTFVDNHGARAFYVARGWAEVPGSEEADPGTGVMELRYERVL